MTQRRQPTALDKARVLARQAGCAICGLPLGCYEVTQFDHEWALKRKGPDTLDNLRAVHADPCHKEKTKKDIKEIYKTPRIAKKQNRHLAAMANKGTDEKVEKPFSRKWPTRKMESRK